MPEEPKKSHPVLALLRLLPRVSLPLSILTPIGVIASGFLPTAFTLAGGLVVTRVKPAVASGSLGSPAGHRLVVALGLLASVFVIQQVLGPFRQLLVFTFGRRVNLHLRSRVMDASLAPHGVEHLEDPATLDTLSLARGVGVGDANPGDAVRGLFGLMYEYTQWAGSAIIVAHYWWWVAVLLIVMHVVGRYWLRNEITATFEVIIGNTTALRRSRYFRDLILTPGAAKEARVFGLRAWILTRFGEYWLDGMRGAWKRRARSWRAMGMILVILLSSYTVAFLMIAHGAGHGLSPAAVTVLAGAILGFATFNMDSDLMLAQGVGAIPPTLALEKKLHARTLQIKDAPSSQMPARSIRFEGVTFRYPGSDREVFEGLDLEIPAGRSLAIVGPNGAGKTTLVKLLSSLYQPAEGRIAVDGIDLRALDPQGWQRRIGAIFQDFVQYQLPAADNVGFGAIEHLSDRDTVAEVARLAGAHAIIDALPNGWDTILSRQYTGGADLSGGEWQRLALARALFAVRAGAGVLVLDEPTANLDVRAEAELFDRFLELTAGLTTILISHRFSTVRRAQHIVVLEQGRVSESGTHEELLALNGAYAEMFRLQAARFVEDAAVEAR